MGQGREDVVLPVTKSDGSPNYAYNRVDGRGLLLGWTRAEGQHSGIGFDMEMPANVEDAPTPVQLGREGHVLTVAPTGAGKGVSCIIPALLNYEGPMIVIDPKGENAAVTARRRREMGQQVFVVDPLGVSGMDEARLNPLDVIDPNFADATDHAAMLANMLVPKFEKDPYWSNRAIQVLIGLMMYVAHDMPKGSRSLPVVRDLLTEVTANPEAAAAKLADATHEEARTLAAALQKTASTTLYSILSVACDAMDMFRGDSLRYSLYASSFDLAAVTRGDPMTIYLVLPPHMLKSHGAVLRLWVGALFAAITRRTERPELATLFVIDEAAQLGHFDPLLSAITLMRGYGLRTWSFWQDASQLQRLYSDWPTIVNNCSAIQIFGRMGGLASNHAAELLGMTSPSIFQQLDRDDMVLTLGGEEPSVVRRPNYLDDPELDALADENPFYAGHTARPRRLSSSADGSSSPQDPNQLELFKKSDRKRPPRLAFKRDKKG